MITAMVKISTRVPELRAPAIDYLLDHLNSQSTEVVQRCREGAELLSSNDIVLKKSLTTPKYMGILYEFTPNQTPQTHTPTRRASMHSPYSSYSQEVAGHHVRKASEGQWNSNLISPIKKVPTDYKFDLHENSPKSNLESKPESQVVLEPMSMDSDISPFQSNFVTMTNSPIVPSLEHSEITKILETFYKDKRGILFQDDNIAIYALIEEKLPVLTITYNIQNNSSIPMSIDKFEIPEEMPGLQFVFGERPSIIAANSFVLIRDHCRAVNAFQKYPLLSASFNGWDYYLPCPVINKMFSSEIENVSQESFVEKWKYLSDKSMKQSVSNTPVEDKQIDQVMMNALGWNKCIWSPQTRNAYIGSYKIAAANAGILIVFSITANNETCVEVRATEASMLQPIINVIKNAVLDLV
ncbi:hypothetical protein TVAG_047020 [Trichomonas vaginalis G3]|uniref:Uncharacterized protein n=2 Tax=Trichomonas vaginalis (strain ATCC PRA-98 / G3) TaxID=412133 RepID=A2EAS7_TRIV3|nr:hypothetical protein TVAG_047020 [Trichomonas vaginalis G3]|eukprot:XP_001322503.1 hypothetical protein [Trichomonas vaginalis G3]